MKVVFRADASSVAGMGHVMRCATLARTLRAQGAEVSFICRTQLGDSIDWLRENGFRVEALPGIAEPLPATAVAAADAEETARVIGQMAPVDWLVVDHYGIAADWEMVQRPLVGRIMAIDDLANRRHECDILLDQNFYLNAERRYDDLVPAQCQKFLGPRYVLLREEFYQFKRSMRQRDGRVRHIMCFFGAGDASGETLKLLAAMDQVALDKVSMDVIVGNANPARQHIAELCARKPLFTYHCQTNTMAELCARADLALGAGGSANWERAFLGLPSQVLITAENQMETTQAMESVGGIWLLGEAVAASSNTLAAAILEALDSPERLQAISQTALNIMDAQGAHGALALSGFMLQ